MMDIASWRTARLTGRRPTPEDAASLRLLHADPLVMATLSADGQVLDAAATQQTLGRMLAHWDAHGFGVWMLEINEDRAFAGYCGLHHDTVDGQPEVELLYALRSPLWRRGLMRQAAQQVVRIAFTQLQLPALVCYTLPTNKPSRGVMEALGFRYDRPFTHAGLPHVLYRLAVDGRW